MKRKLTAVVLAVLLIFQVPALVACKGDEGLPTPTGIATVLVDGTHNDDVVVSGVVYATVADGFYISDDSGNIFVSMAEYDFVVGDELLVQGKFRVISERPVIQEATVVEIGTDKEPNTTATAKEIGDILQMNATRTNFSSFFTVRGFVQQDATLKYFLRDINDVNKKLYFTHSMQSQLSSSKGLSVSVKAILREYDSTDKWTLDVAGGATGVTPITLQATEFTAQLQAYIDAQVPEIMNAISGFSLPVTFPAVEGMTIAWTAATSTSASVTDNKLTVTPVESTEVSVELTAVATLNSTTVTLKRTIKVQPVVLQTIGQLLTAHAEGSYPVSGSSVYISGRVVALTRNQNGTGDKEPEASLRAIVLWDSATNKTITVEVGASASSSYTFEWLKTVNIGDDVKVKGGFRTSTDRLAITVITSWETVATAQPVDYTQMGAEELIDEEDYTNLRANENAYGNKLVKIVNPFASYSGSSINSTINGNGWLRFAPGADKFTSKHPAVLLTGAREALGNDFWHAQLNVPDGVNNSVQINMTIYAYVVFSAGSYIPLTIPSEEAIVYTTAKDQVRYDIGKDLQNEFKVPVDAEGLPTAEVGDKIGELTLPETHQIAGALTWSSDNVIIDVATGEVKAPDVDTIVTLEVEFTIEEAAITLEFEVKVFAPPKAEPLTVTEALQKIDGTTLDELEGVVVGFVHSTQPSGTNERWRYEGMIISDGVNILLIENFNATSTTSNQGKAFRKTIGDWSYYCIQVPTGVDNETEDHIITVGDKLLFSNVIINNTASKVSLTFGWNTSNMELLEENVDLTITATPEVVVDSHAKMGEVFLNSGNKIGQLIKFEADEENPFFFIGNTTDYVGYLRFHYNKETTATSGIDASIKYGDRQVIFGYIPAEAGLKQASGKMMKDFFGIQTVAKGDKDKTVIDLDDNKGIVAGNADPTSVKGFGFTGTLYAVFVAQGGSTWSHIAIIYLPGTGVERWTPPAA